MCIGEAMVELSLGHHDDISLGFAGDTLNTAIYLKRFFGDSANVSYCTVLGTDPLSTRLVRFIESESIDTSAVSFSEQCCVGIYSISTDKDGERTFNYWRDNSAARTLFTNNDFSVLDNFDVVYLSAITLAILPDNIRTALLEKLAVLRNTNKTQVAFDSNYRPALWESESVAKSTIDQAWRITDIALPSVDDELAVFKDNDESELLERFSSYGVTLGALKRGAAGPIGIPVALAAQDNSIVDYPSINNVVDTTAAGDSFNAGFLHAILSGSEHSSALLAGHNCATKVIGYPGAIVPKDQW